MKLYLRVLSTIVVLLFFSSAALAQSADTYSGEKEMGSHPMMGQGMYPRQSFWKHHGHKRHHRRGFGNAAEHFLHMKDKIGLNHNQIDQLKILRDAYRAENTINQAKLKLAKQELKELLYEDTINSEKAEAKIKEISALELPIRISSAKQLAKIKTIISKDQMKKLHQHLHKKHDDKN